MQWWLSWNEISEQTPCTRIKAFCPASLHQRALALSNHLYQILRCKTGTRHSVRQRGERLQRRLHWFFFHGTRILMCWQVKYGLFLNKSTSPPSPTWRAARCTSTWTRKWNSNISAGIDLMMSHTSASQSVRLSTKGNKQQKVEIVSATVC